MNFRGWQAIAVIVVFLGILGVRLMAFSDKKDNKALMREIELQLLCDYLPNDADRLKAAYETGDMDKLGRVAKSVTSTKLNVDSVQASYPVFDFSARKDVVVKVRYSLNDASGTREKGTNYYLFKHGSLGNVWQYKYDTSEVSYYLNFF
jgi:hypothetical protein